MRLFRGISSRSSNYHFSVGPISALIRTKIAVFFYFDPTADSVSVSEWRFNTRRARYPEKVRLFFKSAAVRARNSQKKPRKPYRFRPLYERDPLTSYDNFRPLDITRNLLCASFTRRIAHMQKSAFQNIQEPFQKPRRVARASALV